VVEYSLSKDGRLLVYTVSSRAKEETNGVYAVTPGDAEPAFPVLAGKGRYQRLTWDREQTQLAFLSDRDDAAETQAKFKLYVWSRPVTEPRPDAAPSAPANGPEATPADAPAARRTAAPQPAVEVLSSTTPGFRNGWVISDNTGLSFSRDGRRIIFNTAPA